MILIKNVKIEVKLSIQCYYTEPNRLQYVIFIHLPLLAPYFENDLNTVQYSERDINIHPMCTLVGNYIYTKYIRLQSTYK